MFIKYEYSGKEFFIEPYNTRLEKDILIASHIGADSYDNILSILGVNSEIIKTLTDNEKIAMLYKFRNVSVGEDLQLKYKCKHCGMPNETAVSIDNIITDSNIKNTNIKDAFIEPTFANIQEFTDLDVNELDLDEYEKLYEDIKNQVTRFNFLRPTNCISCRKVNNINIATNAVDNMSEDSLVSMYQMYNDLIFFGKYSKQDIDTMYPFERTILIGLMNKTREALSK